MPAQPEVLLKHSVVDSDHEDTPERCSARRRRRIELRRQMRPELLRVRLNRTSSGSAVLPRRETSTTKQHWIKNATGQGTSNVNAVVRQTPVGLPFRIPFRLPATVPGTVPPAPAFSSKMKEVNPMPVFGIKSIQGLAKTMDDAWFVKKDFCYPQIVSGQPIHFFAVYDGHGGSHVSSLCKRVLHDVIAEQMTRANIGRGAPNKGGRVAIKQWENLVRACLMYSFDTVDKMANDLSIPERRDPDCPSKPAQLVFSGSTAIVAMLTSTHIVVANCGDSRAVLCRGNTAIRLSVDHKPERPDELARITAAGGQLIYRNGLRVQGILNMSRSIGNCINITYCS